MLVVRMYFFWVCTIDVPYALPMRKQMTYFVPSALNMYSLLYEIYFISTARVLSFEAFPLF